MINTENYVNSSDNLKLGLIDNIENYANNSNTIKTIKDKDVEMTNEEILKEGRQLIDNPSDITLNINDFLEQQEEHLKIFNSNIPKNNNETEDNLELERKLKYPINSPNCPVYLRYMNILKNDYSNVGIHYNIYIN